MQGEITRNDILLKVIYGYVVNQSCEVGAVGFKGIHLTLATGSESSKDGINSDVGTYVIKHVAGMNILHDPIKGAPMELSNIFRGGAMIWLSSESDRKTCFML